MFQEGELIVKYHQRDEPSTDLYMKKHQLSAIKINSVEDLKPLLEKNKQVFLLTSHRNMVVSELNKLERIHLEVLTHSYIH